MFFGLAKTPSRRALFCLLGVLSLMAPAGATMPALSWKGVERVAVLCQVASDQPIDNDVVAKALCDRVKSLAERGAPVPVEVVSYGHPSLQSGNTMALLVQASVSDVAPSRPALIFTARTDRTGGLEPAPTYFGTAPRVAPFTSAADSAAWDSALSASLSEILPWLRPAGIGELSPIKRERNRNVTLPKH